MFSCLPSAENVWVHIVLLGKHKGDNALWKGCLNNGDAEEGAAEADGEGGAGHDSRADEEPHGHGESCLLVPASYDPWLQRHE